MRKFAIAASAVLAAAIALPLAASPAGAQTANLNFVHAATYDFPAGTLLMSLCVDDVLVDDTVVVGDVVSPISVTAPTANVEVFNGTVADCTGTPAQTLAVAVGAGEDVTVVRYYDINTGPTLTSFVNDQTCVAPGSARLSAFQAADYGGASVADVYYGPAMSGNLTLLFQSLANGTLDTADIVAGNYDGIFTDSGNDPNTLSLGEVTNMALPEGTAGVMFLAGGNDGESGAFAIYSQVPVCQITTTTPTVAQTSSSLSGAGTGAAAVTPVFTG